VKYAYFPGCSLSGTAREYERSTRAVARVLGLELEEIPDWSCCGATSAHATDKLLSLALPARSLARADEMGLDVVAPCAACFNRLRTTVHAVRSDRKVRQEVEEVLGQPYAACSDAYALPDVIVNRHGLDNIVPHLKKSLGGLKVACYYGCLLVRPSAVTAFDDPEDPQTMDRLVRALGGEPVVWPAKTECCGASLSITRTRVVWQLAAQILTAAQKAGAEAIVVACPFCQSNLDMRQVQAQKWSGRRWNIPVYYFTQLLGVALGLPPGELGLESHFVDPLGVLRQKALV